MVTVTLRKANNNDIDFIYQLLESYSNVSTLVCNFQFRTYEQAYTYYKEKFNSSDIRCMILDSSADTTLGVINLTNITDINRSAEVSILIEKEWRGKGVGYAALKAIKNHAFQDLNLHRLWLTVLDDNIPAIKLYEKIGFTQEGWFKDAVFKQGQYKNVIQMGLINDTSTTA